ncbi:unnamed protein product [Tuber aestivum]|uniref:Uncharacterized protein n=1 Tax=Tuber aestivum TaxID=59557 RepID=A0A292PVT0_9PEZI|nr:unnamed protein product [Tuber aestivum]
MANCPHEPKYFFTPLLQALELERCSNKSVQEVRTSYRVICTFYKDCMGWEAMDPYDHDFSDDEADQLGKTSKILGTFKTIPEANTAVAKARGLIDHNQLSFFSMTNCQDRGDMMHFRADGTVGGALQVYVQETSVLVDVEKERGEYVCLVSMSGDVNAFSHTKGVFESLEHANDFAEREFEIIRAEEPGQPMKMLDSRGMFQGKVAKTGQRTTLMVMTLKI